MTRLHGKTYVVGLIQTVYDQVRAMRTQDRWYYHEGNLAIYMHPDDVNYLKRITLAEFGAYVNDVVRKEDRLHGLLIHQTPAVPPGYPQVRGKEVSTALNYGPVGRAQVRLERPDGTVWDLSGYVKQLDVTVDAQEAYFGDGYKHYFPSERTATIEISLDGEGVTPMGAKALGPGPGYYDDDDDNMSTPISQFGRYTFGLDKLSTALERAVAQEWVSAAEAKREFRVNVKTVQANKAKEELVKELEERIEELKEEIESGE